MPADYRECVIETLIASEADLRAALRRAEDNLIDLDVVVDDCRREVARALEALRAAVRERNRAAGHLADLVDWARTEL
jgi:hypothetical protein